MTEQYAFAIGFDFESNSDEMGGQSESEIVALANIETALRSAGFPDIHSDRWDEFGQGRIFWGTKPECDAVKQVLSQFQLFLQEERNLESGYYATSASTYYVDEAGNLYRLLDISEHADIGCLESTATIPLDAYRLKTLDPNLQAAVERSLSSISPPQAPPLSPEQPATLAIADDEMPAAHPLEGELTQSQAQVASLTAEIEALRAASNTKIAATEAHRNELQSQIALQSTQIHELERQVTVFEDHIVSLQSTAAAKIDPQLHADLQNQLTQQIQQLEAQSIQAEAQVNEWQAKAHEWQVKAEASVDPQVHAQLQQQLSVQTSKVQELQQILQRLEQQLKETSAIAAQKIEPARYEALEQSLADKTAIIADLRQNAQTLQRDLSEWQTVAESKVDWAEYQALQEDFRQLQAKRKKGLLSRLFGWLFG